MLACALPIAWWGNPYPEGVVPYWAWGGALVAGFAIVIGALPLSGLRRLPSRCVTALTAPTPATFAALLVVAATGLSVAFAVLVFRRSATTSDEMAQLWHARILLSGRLSLPADPNPEFFALENVINAGRWYSQFPIGGPLVLAMGAIVGAPWVINPILAGIAVVMLYAFARRVYGEAQGRAVAALACLTPMLLMMAGTWMNHVSVLCLVTCVLAALVAWERATAARRRLAFAALIGLALGAMATIRPVDAMIVAGVVGVFQLWVIRRQLARLGELVVQGAAGALAVAPLLYANAATTGHPLRFGYDVMWGPEHRVGFHADPYGNVHTLGRALEYAVTYVSELNMYALGWPLPALLVVIAGLLAMRRVTRWDVLLLGLFGAQTATYASYGLVGEFLGPRFLYTALPTVIVFAARMPFLMADRFGTMVTRGATALTLACLAVAWCVPGLGQNVWGLAAQVRGVRRTLRVDIAGTVRAANVHRALVFLHEPFSSRLLRRMWAVGVTRGDAARLLATSDACSLLAAVRAAEADSAAARGDAPRAVARAATAFVRSDQVLRAPDPAILISSRASVTPECRAEVEADLGGATVPFGPALPLEPIGADGRIDGDVVYVTDLGERNVVLRARFGDRTWYRLTVRQDPDGTPQPVLAAY